MAKADSTGSYSYVCDGTTPGSPVLSDGHTTFTAGLSSTVAGLTSFRHEDLLGSLRFQTDSSQSVTGSGLFEAFGAPVGSTGTSMPFGFVGGADCQTDADTGLVLMGHRYYDSRIGRFLSQDPAGDGDNWYAYTDNDPVNNTDPSGQYIQSSALPPLHGRFGSDPGGLFGGQNQLNDFFSSEDDAEERGHQGYLDAVAAAAAKATSNTMQSSSSSDLTLAKDKGNTAYGQISNASSKSIIVEFDKYINGRETLWRLTLEHGFQTTPAVDVDFVLLPSWQGGYWAHLFPYVSYSVVDLPNGLQSVQPPMFRPDKVGNGLFPPSSGYPYSPGFVSGTIGGINRGFVRPISPVISFGYPFGSPL